MPCGDYAIQDLLPMEEALGQRPDVKGKPLHFENVPLAEREATQLEGKPIREWRNNAEKDQIMVVNFSG